MSFIGTLQQIRDGETLARLNDEMLDVVDKVHETGKSGSVTLTLTFKKNGEGAVTISPAVKAKKPEQPLGDALFFVSGGGALSRRNPRQMDIEDELARARAGKDAAAGGNK